MRYYHLAFTIKWNYIDLNMIKIHIDKRAVESESQISFILIAFFSQGVLINCSHQCLLANWHFFAAVQIRFRNKWNIIAVYNVICVTNYILCTHLFFDIFIHQCIRDLHNRWCHRDDRIMWMLSHLYKCTSYDTNVYLISLTSHT